MTDIFKDGLFRADEWRGGRMICVLTNEEIQTLYAAFLAKLLEETNLRMWPNRNLDCMGTTDGKGKTDGN